MLYLLNAVRSVIGWCSSSPRRAARTPFQARKSRRQPGNSHAGQSDQGEFDLHYYQFNIGDYARDTSHLSLVEHGIYRLLLDWCYLNEKPITTEKALRVGRGFPSETQSVLSEFFLGSDEGWEHPRVNAEIDQFHKKAEINRQNGAKGGRPKTQNNPVGSQSQPIRNPNQEPITINQEPVKPLRKKSAPMPADFQINEVSTAYAQDRKLNIADELVSFANWHTAKGSTFKDWQAAWRTWCDKAVEFGRAKGGSPPRNYESEKDRSRRETYEAMTGRKPSEPANTSTIDAFAERVD